MIQEEDQPIEDEKAINRMIKVERSHQLTFEAEALRQRAKVVDSLAEQLRIAARGKITESTQFLAEAKRLHLEAEASKALI